MEASLRSCTQCIPTETCEVGLNGHVPPHLQCRLVTETVKFLMYQREQIPMPYEHLKQQIALQEQKERKRLSLETKKCLQTLSNIDELFKNLERVFEIAQVTRILILFGSTAVSPKEIYILNLNRLHHHDAVSRVNTKAGVQSLMRTLITNGPLSEVDTLVPTSTIVLLEAHRDSALSWFRPKVTYKLPIRGKRFEIHFSTCSEFNSKEGGHNEDSNLIWYQSPCSIKGLQMKTKPVASTSCF
ncbi:MAD2L1-binding protein-like [Saccoglossus kowalevskii]|uniref:MAD2L1-binding protein-like n=1 Tax=Saccoglossus kowalevskii TaxID=10224 RepID=A0ABM0H097_SACKO|nr:PREDICTED: MAD2L1-binding protein-like [Saccoglossus kowalevskii]